METEADTDERPETLQEAAARLGPWFHNIHLPDGTQTAPDHWLGDFPAKQWRQMAPRIPEDLTGWRALDIGCNAGFYTIELAKRGAHVTAIDVNPHYLEQARWAVSQFGLQEQVELRNMQIYDLAHEEEGWDLVIFMGVFYHLRYPILGLDIVTQKVRRLMVFQTMTLPGFEVYPTPPDLPLRDREVMHERGWPKLAFIEHRVAGDPTNWWVVSHAGIEALLRSSGMRVLESPGYELYFCEPDPDHPSSMTTWNRTEYLAATRQLGRENHSTTESEPSND
jgi:tRNA (mo5U34)-methyltransferase